MLLGSDLKWLRPVLLNPARRVESEPGRPGGWTALGLLKYRLGQQPGQTRATQANPNETRFFFPFQMWDLKPISI